MKYNQINNCDCMGFIAAMPDKSVDFTFTDIPYNLMDRSGNGLRRLDKGNANILTFKLDTFCGKEQFSQVYSYFPRRKAQYGQLYEKKPIHLP